MPTTTETTRVVNIFRYDPTLGESGHMQRYTVAIQDEQVTTILDVLLKIQTEQDPSLAFRFACRVSMCGSCGMVINGRERLACKTVVADLKETEINLRPLNHFPVIKDLAVDMEPFFESYHAALPFFVPSDDSGEPAVIAPDSAERQDIGLSTECIACGCCVSSCTMVDHHGAYCGPAAINRAFTLIADSRDGIRQERLSAVLESCYHCRTEFNCTEVCPKEISPTRAIKYLQKLAFKQALRRPAVKKQPVPQITDEQTPAKVPPSLPRRQFLKRLTIGLASVSAAIVGAVLAAAAIGPTLRKASASWIRVGRMSDFTPGDVTTVQIRYPVQDGFYRSEKVMPVMVSRSRENDRIAVFSSRCTHLGCMVQWDAQKQLFLCACHGGAFYPDGSVKAGPPPRALDRIAFKVQHDSLFVEVT